MNHDSYTDAYLKGVLESVRTIAMVGASPYWNRPSYFVMKYLQAKGFRVRPVNPVAAGETILGETCFGDLADLPEPVDMVDIFRNSEAAGPLADQAVGDRREDHLDAADRAQRRRRGARRGGGAQRW